MREPTLLFRDRQLLAIDKPSGMLVHRGWAADERVATDWVAALVGAPVFPTHRLDRGTSGVLLFALTPEAAAAIGAQFEAGEVRKRYLALCRGHAPDAAAIDHALRPHDPKTGKRRKADSQVPPLAARTDVRCLARVSLAVDPDEHPGVGRCCVVEARPLTGRTHQIRRHLKHLSHPLLGDVRYGKGALNKRYRARYGLARLGLHAAALTVRDPSSDRPLRFVAPLPPDLLAPLRALGFDPAALALDLDIHTDFHTGSQTDSQLGRGPA